MRVVKIVISSILLAALVGVGLFVGIVFWQKQRQYSNERTAEDTLQLLIDAEEDFRGNDRDGNGIADFLTGDIAGLYSFRATRDGKEAHLIPREVAEADAAPLKPLVPMPIPYRGYLFRALDTDRSSDPPDNYRQATDKEGGKVHHPSKFGFVAYPVRFGETGRFSFIANQGGFTHRLRADGSSLRDWPKDPSGFKLTFQKSPPTPTTVIRNVDAELPRTTVTANLSEKHVRGRNLLWCASFQLAWDDLGRTLRLPLDLEGQPEMATALNRHLVDGSIVDPGKVLAIGGPAGPETFARIREEMRRKFPGVEAPDFPRDDPDGKALAFAYLQAHLPFALPLFRHEGISFQGKKVSAFGLWEGLWERWSERGGPEPAAELLEKTVKVCAFGEDFFVVTLQPAAKDEKIIIARGQPGNTLFDTVTAAMRFTRNPQYPPGGIRKQDTLIVPCVNFDLKHRFREVEGSPHRFLRGDGWIKEAWQTLKFRLDEEGASLEALAHASASMDDSPGRRMVCEGPFLILLVHGSAELPYFALWVENDELLVR
jgi:hypothetical protein